MQACTVSTAMIHPMRRRRPAAIKSAHMNFSGWSILHARIRSCRFGRLCELNVLTLVCGTPARRRMAEPSCGSSCAHHRPACCRNEGDVWRTAIEVPVGVELEYKLVHVPAAAAQPRWEDGDNHSVHASLRVRCHFGPLQQSRRTC